MTHLSRPAIPLIAWVYLCGLLTSLSFERGSQEDERPNVIVILTDDMGYADLGVTGNPVVRTPHLDGMASRSAEISHFYVAPFCGPTRAALLTGQYPHRSGVHSNGATMSSGATTLAELMQGAGYATGIFGKWHLGAHYPRRAMDQGFDESVTSRGGIIGMLAPQPSLGRYTNPILDHHGELVEYEGYGTDVLFDECLAWIDEVRGEKSFFAYVPTNAPHRPLHDVPDAPYRELAERLDESADEAARVYAMIENIDANVGRMFDRLEAWGELENTLVVFLSDNGPIGERHSGGFRGGKGSVYEGGVRTPFFAHWPARLKAGHTSDRVAAHIDLLPTLLEACGIPIAAELALDGRSLLPLLSGEEVEWSDRLLFADARQGRAASPRAHFAVRSQDWKLVQPMLAGDKPRQPGARAALNLDTLELFDMRVDPLETSNVVAEHRDLAASMGEAFWEFSKDIPTLLKAEDDDTRIRFGLSEEDPVVLSHAHWGRLSGDGEGGERKPSTVQAASLWPLRCMRSGLYDVVLRFPASSDAAVAAISFSGKARRFSVDRKADVEPGATEVTFENVKLGESRYQLLAVVGPTVPRGRPVWQVEIRQR